MTVDEREEFKTMIDRLSGVFDVHSYEEVRTMELPCRCPAAALLSHLDLYAFCGQVNFVTRE